MKKFLLSFLCFLLAVAGGYAEETVTFNFKELYGTSTVDATSKTVDGITISYAKNSAGNVPAYNKDGELRLYYNSSGNGCSATFTTDGTKKITKAVITASSTSYTPTVKYSVDGSNLVAGTWNGAVMTISDLSASNTLMIQNANTSNKQLRIKSVVLTVETITSGGGETPEPEAPNAPTLSAPRDFYYAMHVEITNIPDGATVYYTTDNSTPSALNGTEYTAPFEITETTPVKAIAVNEAGSSEEVSATYTKIEIPEGQVIDVLNREWTGVASTVYSNWSGKTSNSSVVYSGNSAGDNDAIQLRSNNENSGIVTTTSGGKVKKVIVEWESNTQNGRTLNVYGKNSAYTSPADLYDDSKCGKLLGTIVKGTSTELEVEGNSAYIGLRSNNGAMYLKSIIIVWETSTTPVAPIITFDGEATFEDEKVVTITAAKGTAIYYTLDGSEPNNNSDECPETITLKADATLKVIAYDEDGYKSDIVEQKFTLASSGSAESSTGTATLVTDTEDLAAGNQVVIVASGNDVALSTNQKDNNRGQVEITKDGENVILNDDVQRLTLEEGTKTGTYAFSTGSGYLYAASSSNNNLKTQTTNNDNGSWAITIDGNGVASIVAQGSNTRNVMRYNQSSSLFSCYAVDKAPDQKNVSLYKVNTSTIEDPVLNVTPAGWATLYLGYNVVIPEGVTCYVASEINGESVKLVEVTDVLPANTAVIVKAAEGEYTFEVTKETATVESKMRGTTKNEYITEEAYVLADGDDGVALYKVVMNGGVFLNNANKAYLPASALPQTLNAKALKFNFDTTGVEGVKVETEGKKVIYDLSGRRMNEMTQPGVYIVNGKKMMVK